MIRGAFVSEFAIGSACAHVCLLQAASSAPGTTCLPLVLASLVRLFSCACSIVDVEASGYERRRVPSARGPLRSPRWQSADRVWWPLLRRRQCVPSTRSHLASLLRGSSGCCAAVDAFKYLNDVWAIDVDTMTWHNPRCAGGGPAARYGHTCTVIDFSCVFDTRITTMVLFLPLNALFLFFLVRRFRSLYIFGGKGADGMLFNDVWKLDVEKWAWTLMPTTTAPPSPRYDASNLPPRAVVCTCH